MPPGRTNGKALAPPTGAERLPRPLELPEILFAAIFIPIAAFSWVGILLAELGAFSGWRVFAGGALVSGLAWGAAARDFLSAQTEKAPVPAREWLSLALVLAISAGFFSRPGEYLIEGADASIYLATGRHIARSGEIISSDPVVALVPADLRQLFFPADRRDPHEGNRLPGGLRIAGDGTIAPSFFHLLPVWIAIATASSGPHGGYYVNGVLALLSVMVVWLIGRRVWSPAAGVVATALLALNFGQIYYARIATSEVLAQFLLLSGIFFTVLARDSRTRAAGACAGVAIGLAAFARIDALFLMVPLAVAWLMLTRRRQASGKAWMWFAATLTLVAGHAIVHAGTIARLYTERLLADGWGTLSAQPARSALAALAAVAVLIALSALARRGRWLLWIALSVSAVLAVFTPSIVSTSSLLLSPLGLTTASIGVLLVLARPLDWRVLPVIVPFLAQLVLLLAWREVTTLPADFRRAVPLILPGALLLIGFVVSDIGRGRGWLRRSAWFIPLVLAGTYVRDAAPILTAPLARGIHQQISELAEQIPENAVVFTDRSLPGHLALALQYTFNRSSLRLDSRPPGELPIAPAVEQAIVTGRPVFAAIAPLEGDRPDGLRRSDLAAFDVREEFRYRLHTEIAQPVRGTFPKARRVDDLPVALYRITRRDAEGQAPWPLTIDIGADDFPFIIQGFHAAETFDSSRARWTTGESRVAVPRMAGPSATRRVLVLRLSAHRPPGIAPAAVRLSVDGLPLGTISGTTSELREYRLQLTDAILARVVAGPTILTISTDTFIPKALGVNDDGRRLGIVLDWIRIE